jgi:hypothetical protein
MFAVFANEDARVSLAHLPDTPSALVPLYLDLLREYDAAMRDQRFSDAFALIGGAEDFVERIRLNPEYSQLCFHDVAKLLDAAAAAPINEVPMWGQAGTFVANLSVTKIRFTMHGLLSSLSARVDTYAGRVVDFHIGAVEELRPFFSETGYRSMLVTPVQDEDKGRGVDLFCGCSVRRWWNSDLKGRKTVKALPRIGEQYRAGIREREARLAAGALDDED